MRIPLIPIMSLAMTLIASSGTGCGNSGGNNTEKEPEGDPAAEQPNEPGKDEEDELAVEPTEVTGAFLTGFGKPTGDAIQDKPGYRPVGINVFLAATGLKVTDPVAVLELKYTDNGNTVTVKPETPPGYTEWQAVIYVPESTPEPIPEPEVLVTINESKEFSLAGVTLPATGSVAGQNPGPRVGAPTPLENVAFHEIYVTNGRYKPGIDFMSVLDANKICNREAAADPDLSTVWWKAVLADERQTIAQRIPLYGPVKNLLGEELIAANQLLASATFGDGLLQFANFGTIGSGDNNLTFTGSKKDGSIGETCGSWSSSSGNATAGNPASGSDWIESAGVNCGQARRLYCISSKKKAAP